jgi:hypothetical protein
MYFAKRVNCSYPAIVLSSAPLLGEATNGAVLKLTPSGSWTVGNATALENLFNVVAPAIQKSKGLKIDMADVGRAVQRSIVSP